MLCTPGQCRHGNQTTWVGLGGGPHKACLTACLMSHQNWAGMRCPYKLLRMVLALVCSK